MHVCVCPTSEKVHAAHKKNKTTKVFAPGRLARNDNGNVWCSDAAAAQVPTATATGICSAVHAYP